MVYRFFTKKEAFVILLAVLFLLCNLFLSDAAVNTCFADPDCPDGFCLVGDPPDFDFCDRPDCCCTTAGNCDKVPSAVSGKCLSSGFCGQCEEDRQCPGDDRYYCDIETTKCIGYQTGRCNDDSYCAEGLECVEGYCMSSFYGNAGRFCNEVNPCIGTDVECLSLNEGGFECVKKATNCPLRTGLSFNATAAHSSIDGYCMIDSDKDGFCDVDRFVSHPCVEDCDSSSNILTDNCSSTDDKDLIECSRCSALYPGSDLRNQCEEYAETCYTGEDGSFLCAYSASLAFGLELLQQSTSLFSCSLKDIPDAQDWCIDVDDDKYCSDLSTRKISADFFDALNAEQKAELSSHGWIKYPGLNDKLYQGVTESLITRYFSSITPRQAYDCMSAVLEPDNTYGKTEAMVMDELEECFPARQIPPGLLRSEKTYFNCPSCDSFVASLLYDDGQLRNCRTLEESLGCVENYLYSGLLCDEMNWFFAPTEYVYACATCETIMGNIPVPECMDKIDNDNDGVSDAQDPECHTDSNAANFNTYDRFISKEDDITHHKSKYEFLEVCRQFEESLCSESTFNVYSSDCTALETLEVEELEGLSAEAYNELLKQCRAGEILDDYKRCKLKAEDFHILTNTICFDLDVQCRELVLQELHLVDFDEFRNKFNEYFQSPGRQEAYSTILHLDCDDSNPNVNPINHEDSVAECTNFVEDDCDGLIDIEDPDCKIDEDKDGFVNSRFGGDDCNDANHDIYPGAPDLTIDRIDQNCNGIDGDGVDSDSDGVPDVMDQCLDENPLYSASALHNVSGCPVVPGWEVESEVYVVEELTSPTGVYGKNVLKILDGFVYQKVLVNSSNAHTISFYYKVESGSLDFAVIGSDIQPRAVSSALSDNRWTRHVEVIEPFREEVEEDMYEITIVFYVLADSSVFVDGVMLEENSEATVYRDFVREKGCCPSDFCWTGTTCVHDALYENNITKPPIGSYSEDSIFGRDGYRCINGSWDYSTFAWDPIQYSGGYCPKATQCFLWKPSAEMLPVEDVCIDSGTFEIYKNELVGFGPESFYCYNGEWTTRTKALALKLLNLTDSNDDYTLFCDKQERVLNPALENALRGLDFDIDSTFTFSNNINEFCVLNLKPNGDEENSMIVVGVSLNNGIDEPVDANNELSFIELIKGPDLIDYCSEVPEDSVDFVSCNDIFNDVWYSSGLKSVIFTKNDKEVLLAGPESFIDRTIEALKNVFAALGLITLPEPSDTSFVELAHFDKLYMSQDIDGERTKTIKAVRESRVKEPGSDKLDTEMRVEYNNYAVDVCGLLKGDQGGMIAEYAFGENLREDTKFKCGLDVSATNWTYSVSMPNPDVRSDADNFWNDLTAKIRSQDVGYTAAVFGTGSASLSIDPADDIVPGTKVKFNVSDYPDSLAFITFDFGDGETGSLPKEWLKLLVEYDYDLVVQHNYSKPGIYSPKAYLMNASFSIGVVNMVDLQVDNFDFVLVEPVELDDVQQNNARFTVNAFNGSRPINVYYKIGNDEYSAGESMACGDWCSKAFLVDFPEKGLSNITIKVTDNNQVAIEKFYTVYVG